MCNVNINFYLSSLLPIQRYNKFSYINNGSAREESKRPKLRKCVKKSIEI